LRHRGRHHRRASRQNRWPVPSKEAIGIHPCREHRTISNNSFVIHAQSPLGWNFCTARRFAKPRPHLPDIAGTLEDFPYSGVIATKMTAGSADLSLKTLDRNIIVPGGNHRSGSEVNRVLGTFELSQQQEVGHHFERFQLQGHSQIGDYYRIRQMNDSLGIFRLCQLSRGDFRWPGRTARKGRLRLRTELLFRLAHNSNFQRPRSSQRSS